LVPPTRQDGDSGATGERLESRRDRGREAVCGVDSRVREDDRFRKLLRRRRTRGNGRPRPTRGKRSPWPRELLGSRDDDGSEDLQDEEATEAISPMKASQDSARPAANQGSVGRTKETVVSRAATGCQLYCEPERRSGGRPGGKRNPSGNDSQIARRNSSPSVHGIAGLQKVLVPTGSYGPPPRGGSRPGSWQT